MMNTLTKGTSLIIDRYAYSGVAYTAAKQVAFLTTGDVVFLSIVLSYHLLIPLSVCLCVCRLHP